MKLAKKTELTLENILQKVSEFDIFTYFIGHFKIGQAFCSPLRHENNPSVAIYLTSSGLRYKDYTTGESFDAVEFVKAKYHCNYNDALLEIDKAFGLGLSSQPKKDYKAIISTYSKPVLDQKRYTLIEVKTKKFTQDDINYWADYYIPLNKLKRENVYSLEGVWINKKKQPLNKGELCFGYFFENVGWKIYHPLRAKGEHKWLSNIPLTHIENINNIQHCDILTVTKSKKDRLILEDFFPDIINTQNESKGCFTPENIALISSKGDKIRINFDGDNVGKTNSKKLTQENNWQWLNVPNELVEKGIKDFSDMAKELGIKAVKDYFKSKKLI